MLRVAVLVSGGGTNLQAVIDKIEAGEIRNAKIVGVISNNAGAYALDAGERSRDPGRVRVARSHLPTGRLSMKASWPK